MLRSSEDCFTVELVLEWVTAVAAGPADFFSGVEVGSSLEAALRFRRLRSCEVRLDALSLGPSPAAAAATFFLSGDGGPKPLLVFRCSGLTPLLLLPSPFWQRLGMITIT